MLGAPFPQKSISNTKNLLKMIDIRTGKCNFARSRWLLLFFALKWYVNSRYIWPFTQLYLAVPIVCLKDKKAGNTWLLEANFYYLDVSGIRTTTNRVWI